MDKLNTTAENYGMKINIKKTKIMKVFRNVGEEINIMINGSRIEQVKSFKYLGSTMTEDGTCETEIKVRIALSKEAFSERREVLTKSFRKEVKKKIVKTLVWSTLLCESETWTLRKEDIRKLEAVEMWMWRRIERVSWTDNITNEEILNKVEEK